MQSRPQWVRYGSTVGTRSPSAAQGPRLPTRSMLSTFHDGQKSRPVTVDIVSGSALVGAYDHQSGCWTKLHFCPCVGAGMCMSPSLDSASALHKAPRLERFIPLRPASRTCQAAVHVELLAPPSSAHLPPLAIFVAPCLSPSSSAPAPALVARPVTADKVWRALLGPGSQSLWSLVHRKSATGLVPSLLTSLGWTSVASLLSLLYRPPRTYPTFAARPLPSSQSSPKPILLSKLGLRWLLT